MQSKVQTLATISVFGRDSITGSLLYGVDLIVLTKTVHKNSVHYLEFSTVVRLKLAV